MKMLLAENIRMFRKQRSLTQEQLAEALGVTAGAVYKWEAKLSLPELHLIVEMADFFDTSVDVLLGYKMKDNRLAATVQQLKGYRHDKDRAGLNEAEKALKKYPHAFDVVHESAVLYRVFGVESQKKDLLRRALELLQESLVLLPQNTDIEISEQTICGEMAEVYLMLDEGEKSVELLKKHNAGGLYNDMIGLTLATNRKRPEEAVPFLSEALLQNVTALIRTVMGYVNVFCARHDYSSAEAILLWGIELLSGLKEADRPSFLDKMNGVFHVCLSYTQIKTGNTDGARVSLEKALTLARCFDAAPSYDASTVRFAAHLDRASAHDNLGMTAMESLENAVKAFADEMLSALWREMNEHEK
ncbi:MAG: helix-turn-helix transcriptional regulator [Clostridia bacterium]|nr:helix-turn-helix transcriptional regulator [Clostridia bacterium]